MALWLKEGGPESDVVVSTRVRLARNLAGLPFPHRIMGTERVREVKEPVKECFLKNGMDFSCLSSLRGKYQAGTLDKVLSAHYNNIVI